MKKHFKDGMGFSDFVMASFPRLFCSLFLVVWRERLQIPLHNFCSTLDKCGLHLRPHGRRFAMNRWATRKALRCRGALPDLRRNQSNQLDDPPLRVGMRFDVALGGRDR
jgi:hypothetical protein